MSNFKVFQGKAVFYWVWIGQVVSLLGTSMSRFAMLIWAYQQTGAATTLGLLGFFGYLPYILVVPLAGTLVDRWDRRKVLMLADIGSGLVSTLVLFLYSTGGLQIWQILLAEALTSIFEAFQGPAFTASVSVLVDRKDYMRSNGMMATANSATQIFAPVLAGMVLSFFDLKAVLYIDLITFLCALLTLAVVRIPRPVESADGRKARGNFWKETSFGFRYIFERKGLLGILVIFTFINLFAALTYYAVMPALILERSGGSEPALGTVQAMLGLGGVIGGLVISVWGGPKSKIKTFLLSTILGFLFGDFLFAVSTSLPWWIVASLVSSIPIPFLTGSCTAIWQAKVAPDVQGRVFAVRSMLQVMVMPFGYLAGGLLADHVFGPAMAAGGWLVGTFGWLVGTGPGAGIAVMFLCTCIGGVLTGLSGFLFPAVRNVERDLPDFIPEEVESPSAELNPCTAD